MQRDVELECCVLLESIDRADDWERRSRDLLGELARVRRRAIDGKQDWHQDLQRVQLELNQLDWRMPSSFSAFAEASIDEIRAWEASRLGCTSEALELYRGAGLKLVDWLRLTSSELLAKSVMLHLPQSPAAVESAYRKHFGGVADESWAEAQARFFLEDVVPDGTVAVRPSPRDEARSTKPKSPQQGWHLRLVLRHLRRGRYRLALFLLLWSNIDRHRFIDEALVWADELCASGDANEATVLLASLYAQNHWIYHPGTRVYALLKIALQCDETNTGFAKSIHDEIFESLESGLCTEHKQGSYPPITQSMILHAVGHVARELVSQGRADCAQSLTSRFLKDDTDDPWDNGALVKEVALAFAEIGENQRALEVVGMLSASSLFRKQLLDDVYRRVLRNDGLDIRSIHEHMQLSYESNVTPSLLREVSEKASDYCEFDLALEVARSIDQPYARTFALVYCARNLEAFHELVLDKLRAPGEDLGPDAQLLSQDERSFLASITEAFQKQRIDQIVGEAREASDQGQDLVKGIIKTGMAVRLRYMNRMAEAEELLDAVERISDEYPYNAGRSELERGLARVDMVFESFEDAFSRARAIPLSRTRVTRPTC